MVTVYSKTCGLIANDCYHCNISDSVRCRLKVIKMSKIQGKTKSVLMNDDCMIRSINLSCLSFHFYQSFIILWDLKKKKKKQNFVFLFFFFCFAYIFDGIFQKQQQFHLAMKLKMLQIFARKKKTFKNCCKKRKEEITKLHNKSLHFCLLQANTFFFFFFCLMKFPMKFPNKIMRKNEMTN